MSIDPVQLSQDLIRIPSISGQESNVSDAVNFFHEVVNKIGFESEILNFKGSGGTYEVSNIHSILNPQKHDNILYFAGHLDVVPVGDDKSWKYPPFSAKIDNDMLYGRGVVDMKCAIACFVSALSEFLEEEKDINFGIGLLITGDEEAESINGTKKMLQWMHQNKMQISNCIVGEPTSNKQLGDMIKIGRRGSVGFALRVNGKQGHIAYPENFINPITSLISVMKILKDHNLDNGNEFFDPSNLEITNISSPNVGGNVVPEYATANFNIRFNNSHSSKDLIDWVSYVCSKSIINRDYELTHRVSSEPFITKPGLLSKITTKSILDSINIRTEISTTGGTSDARFIKDFCPVVECGLINKTAHQVNESAKISDIINLKDIYKKTLKLYNASI